MVDKYVYKNIPSLLKYECPNLYVNYEKLLHSVDESKLPAIFDKNLPITKQNILVTSTEIYRIYRIIKGIRFKSKYNVVRLRNDSLVSHASDDNGKIILLGIIDNNIALSLGEEDKELK